MDNGPSDRALEGDADDAAVAYREWAHEERNSLFGLHLKAHAAAETARLLRSDSAELRLRAQELCARR